MGIRPRPRGDGRLGRGRGPRRDRRRVLHRASRRPASATRPDCSRSAPSPSAVLGGLDSTAGALVGGLMIGVAQTLAAGYQDQLVVPRPRAVRRRPLRRPVRRPAVAAVRALRDREITPCLSAAPDARRPAPCVGLLLLAAAVPRGVLAADRPVRDGRGDRGDRADAAGRRHRASCRSRHAFFVAVGAYGYCYLAGGERRRGPGARRARPAAAGWRWSWRSLLAGVAGALVQPDRRPAARHLPGPGVGRARLHRPAHPAERAGDHRRLQRPRRRSRSASSASTSPAPTRRLVVFGVPYGAARAAVVPRARASSLSAGGTRATCCAAGRAGRWSRSATARSPRRSWGSASPVYRGAAFTVVSSMYAGLAGVLPRARVRPHRARVVRLPATRSTSS